MVNFDSKMQRFESSRPKLRVLANSDSEMQSFESCRLSHAVGLRAGKNTLTRTRRPSGLRAKSPKSSPRDKAADRCVAMTAALGTANRTMVRRSGASRMMRVRASISAPDIDVGVGVEDAIARLLGGYRHDVIGPWMRIKGYPQHGGKTRPCRDDGVVRSPDFLRAHAIMRRAGPYRGENSGPGKDDRGELDTETRN
jgi:hypothetical protein